MSEADSVLKLQVTGKTYHPRFSSSLDFVVTPENLALELQAMREGWSRNVWVRTDGRGHELNLWPRYLADAPPLTVRRERDPTTRVTFHQTDGHPGRFDVHDRAFLSRYMWSYDPGRYDLASSPTPATLAARVWKAFDELRPTWTDGPSLRAVVYRRLRRSVLDESGPLDGSDGS